MENLGRFYRSFVYRIIVKIIIFIYPRKLYVSCLSSIKIYLRSDIFRSSLPVFLLASLSPSPSYLVATTDLQPRIIIRKKGGKNITVYFPRVKNLLSFISDNKMQRASIGQASRYVYVKSGMFCFPPALLLFYSYQREQRRQASLPRLSRFSIPVNWNEELTKEDPSSTDTK